MTCEKFSFGQVSVSEEQAISLDYLHVKNINSKEVIIFYSSCVTNFWMNYFRTYVRKLLLSVCTTKLRFQSPTTLVIFILILLI